MPLAKSNEANPIKIFAIKIYSTNSLDQDDFICATQFGIKEPKTYVRAMQDLNTPK